MIRRDPDDDFDVPRPTNRWAVVSLACGIVGCLGVTPVLAVIAGIVGIARSRRNGTGRRAATLGLRLGLAWLIGYALAGAGGVWVVRHGATFVAGHERGRTVGLINTITGRSVIGGADGRRIGATRARELAGVVRPLGVCRDVAVTDAAFTNRDGVFGIEFGGVARFDAGTWPLRARLVFDGTGWAFSELDWQ